MKRQKLVDLREHNDLSQRDMASALGISRSYYGHIENGTRNPDYGLAKRIARLFGQSVDTLFFDLECFRVKQGSGDTPSSTRESAD